MTYNVFSGTLNPTHFTSLHSAVQPNEYSVGSSIAVWENIGS